MKNEMHFDTFTDESFAAEIEEVQSTLLAATTDLTNPLGDLVRAQIRRSQPPICGAVVLAVSKSAPADGDLRRKRILLAAALEMLHIALNVHRLLVQAAINEKADGSDAPIDRAFIGSTILAGDYCFSRAAQLAAQTDHPRVVATFSLALQAVSEGLLREQFSPDDGSYDETRQLLASGAEAAARLIGLSTTAQEQAIAMSQTLATHWSLHRQGLAVDETRISDHNHHPTENVPANWQALYRWLDHHRTNGAIAQLPTPPQS